MRTSIFIFFLLVGFSYSEKISAQWKWPGFVQLNDSVFMSQTEISVRDYAEFLHLMKFFFGSYAHFEEALPSSNGINWKAYDPYTKSIFVVDDIYDVLDSSRHNLREHASNLDTNVSYPSFIGNRPIVNITKKQAMLYCELRTKAFTL